MGYAVRAPSHVTTQSMSYATVSSDTAVPNATTEVYNTSRRRAYVDLSARTKVRLFVWIDDPITGCTCGAQFSDDGGTTWYWLDDGASTGGLGTHEPQVDITTAGPLTSDWVSLVKAARIDGALLRLVYADGATSTVLACHSVLEFL